MAYLNHALREVSCKIVYYGPGLCGKTANVKHVFGRVDPRSRGQLVSLETTTERTLYFDFLPLSLGTVRGFKVRLQLFTVPGQIMYTATRRLVLRGADALVFVADSQEDRFDANLISMEDLQQNLERDRGSVSAVPLVVQYNKRDLPGLVPVSELRARLNPGGAPDFEAAASTGHGVFPTLKAAAGLALAKLGAASENTESVAL